MIKKRPPAADPQPSRVSKIRADKNKKKLTPGSLFKSVYLTILSLVIIVILILAVFLYNNFYKTISYSQDILIMQTKTLLEPISENLYANIKQKLQDKETKPAADWSTMKNPFLPYR